VRSHVALASLAASASLAACRSAATGDPESAAPAAIHCQAPRAQAIDDTVSLRGRLQPPPGGDLPLASQVAGRIAQVLVHEGETIREGDVIATVDDANVRDSARQAQAALDQARATEATAEATLARTQALVARGIAARQELDDAAGKAAEAKAGVAAAAASADLARRTLGRVVVRSSLGGIVTKVWRGAGSLVDGTASTPVAQLAASRGVEFVAAATGADLARVKEGDAVHGSFGAGADFDGTVIVRGRAIDPSTGLGAVRAAVTRLAQDVPMGAYGRATVVIERREGVPTLPTSALRGAVLDGAEVAVCMDGHVQIRKVCVGWRDDDRFEVCDGLASGDRVAVEHVLGLEDGTPIMETK
jgi:membrane fusion protein, multidrug efflux system